MNPTIAIIGAGPYGLSLAAHLRHLRVPHRIFGQPMESWQRHMPDGMCLKSEGFASNLYSPAPQSTLRAFCARSGLDYRDRGLPVPLDTLVSYGLDCQRQFVPHLEAKHVESVEPHRQGFVVRLNDGETFAARKVVMAVGVSHFKQIPTELAALPQSLVSHSYDHRDLGSFPGSDVTIVGSGASALDLAGLLARIGVSVRLVVRRPPVWGTPPALHRTLWNRLR